MSQEENGPDTTTLEAPRSPTTTALAGDGPRPAQPPSVPPPPSPPETTFDRPPALPEDGGPPSGVPLYRSTYLDHLPGIYSDSDFLARFLLIFESVLGPIERTVDNLPHYFDPGLTPSEFVPWLGSWLGLVLDDRWPEQRRRDLIRAAAELYRWRGTKRGLSEFIRLYTGVTPEITEPTVSQVAATRNRAFRFNVRLRVPADFAVDRSLVEAIVDAEKPAFAACNLEMVQG